MQRLIWIILIFINFSFALPQVEFKNSCVPLAQFSESQKQVLLRSYLAGEQDGFGLTLAAIAWQESCAGVYKMNFQDPSAGNFHAYIPGVINRYPQLKQNGFTQNMVGAMLVENDAIAEQIRVKQLESYFKGKEAQENRFKISYNTQTTQSKTWEKSQNATQTQLESQGYYAYGEDSVSYDSTLLPIYQVGNEFAEPFKPKKTIIKEFDLIEIY
ncbi:hypothetical protein [Helicobacter ganmani]|uniref:hypothetical protein n=1 Tax=Helicobacter ganmani TaxID=60246 RepID=UPI003A8874D5